VSADLKPVRLRPWSDGDLVLLRTANSAQMTSFIGGPESEEKLLDRHRRYLASPAPGSGQMFAVEAGPAATLVGSIGYWPKRWTDEDAYETGWAILPAFQGRGLATAATRLVAQHAREHGNRTTLYAFPGAGNLASNAICRKTGFDLIGPADFEYPPGHLMRCNVWRLGLT
jgi:RimJ/RimL family protein N-acetyltransferase